MNHRYAAANASALDTRLRQLAVRNQWGRVSIQNAIFSIGESAFVYASGSKVLTYAIEEGSHGKKSVFGSMNDVTDVKALTVSLDRKLAAVAVRIKGKESVAMVFVYEIDSDVSIRSKTATFTDEELSKSKGSGPLQLYFTCLSFSADSKVLAGTTNMPAAGVAVFDWELEKLIRVIPTKASIYNISFNPGSNAKFCVSGTAGTFEFWHYSARVAHVAPIEGIDNMTCDPFDFTCIEWISSDCIVAGTKTGQLSLVLGCKQMHVYSAFDMDSDPTPKYSQVPVVKFLVKGSSLLCLSSDNRASIFEIKPVLYAAGINGFELELLHRFKFGRMADVNGAAWSSQHPKDLQVLVSSCSGFYKYDLKSVETLLEFESAATDMMTDDASLSLDGTESLGSSSLESLSALKSLGPSALAARANRQVKLRRKKNFLSGLLWGVLRPTKVILRTHPGAIGSMSVSKRSSCFATCSFLDKSVRVWDYNLVNGSDLVVEDFSDRPLECPNSADIHPSGHFIFCGTEDYAVEYAITNSKLEMCRKIPTKVAVESTSGEPFVNTLPVSLVRYSNGGHLVAVVTGRLIQVFHLYNLEYLGERAGTPVRTMTLTEHSAVVTDLTFAANDSKLYSTAMDGSVYEWEVGRDSRISDFVVKGIPAIAVASSPLLTTIAVYYDSQEVAERKKAHHTVKKFASEKPIFQSARSISHIPLKKTPTVDSTNFGTQNSQGEAASRKMFLALFSNGRVLTSDSKIINFDIPVTCMSFGISEAPLQNRKLPGEIFVVGFADGRIMVSMLPVPLRIVEMNPLSRGSSTVLRSASSMPGILAEDDGDMTPATHSFHEDGSVDGTVIFKDTTGSRGPSEIGADDNSVGTNQMSAASIDNTMLGTDALDETKCKWMQLHSSAVAKVVVAPSGHWLLTAGSDGSVFILSTSSRAKGFESAPEALSGDNLVMFTDRAQLLTQMNRIEVIEQKLAEAEADKKRELKALQDNMNATITKINQQVSKEIKLRDDLIIKSRDEQTRVSKALQEEIEALKNNHGKTVQEIEMLYEKRLAESNLYIQNMVQAYDEHTVHARMDIEELKREEAQKIQKLNEKKDEIIQETDKQKAVLLQYYDYINERNKDIFAEVEETYEKEKNQLKAELAKRINAIEEMRHKSLVDQATMNRSVTQHREAIAAKDLEIFNLKDKIQSLNAKVSRLESNLREATSEIMRKTEASERWEYKSGLQQQQLAEVERVRKTLTTQLHNLREQLGPQSELLLRTEEKLREVESEYGNSLQDLSDKDTKIHQSNSVQQRLQKQLKDLKERLRKKEHLLERAAKTLSEYEECFQNARFKEGRRVTVIQRGSENSDVAEQIITSDPSKIVATTQQKSLTGKLKSSGSSTSQKLLEVFVDTPEMASSLKRLREILSVAALGSTAASEDKIAYENAFLTEDKQIIVEQGRRLEALQNSIANLQSSLKLNAAVSQTKTHNFMNDNDILMHEVNNLRVQVKNLSLENQKLQAQIAYYDLKAAKGAAGGGKSSLEDSISVSSKEQLSLHSDMSGYASLSNQCVEKLSAQANFSLSSKSLPFLRFEDNIPGDNDDAERLCDNDELTSNIGESRDALIERIMSQNNSVVSTCATESKLKPTTASERKKAAEQKIADLVASNEKIIAELQLNKYINPPGGATNDKPISSPPPDANKAPSSSFVSGSGPRATRGLDLEPKKKILSSSTSSLLSKLSSAETKAAGGQKVISIPKAVSKDIKALMLRQQQSSAPFLPQIEGSRVSVKSPERTKP